MGIVRRNERQKPTVFPILTIWVLLKGKGNNMEVWKDIKGYEGLYQVSNLGRVKSMNFNNTKKEQILKLCKRPNGYLTVELCRYNIRKRYLVHRLVLETFNVIENMEHLECNHLDENKENNRLDNLCWMTRKENNDWGTRNKRVSKALGEHIICVELNIIFDSISDASRQLGLSTGNICNCLKGRYKTTGGYHWKYVNQK